MDIYPPTYKEFIKILRTHSNLDERRVYTLHYTNTSTFKVSTIYFDCDLSKKCFRGNLWRAMLKWNEYLKEESNMPGEYLLSEYERVLSKEFLTVDVDKLKKMFPELRELNCDEDSIADSYMFIYYVVDDMFFDNGILWMQYSELD